LELFPNHPEVHYNISQAFLLSGNFKDGFKEYEWRFKVHDYFKYCFLRPSDFSQPLWNGSNIEGATILVYSEQGFGDAIQFSRYIPFVSKLGARVIFQCHNELSSLLKSLEGVEQFIVQGEPLPYFEVQCPLLTLPLVFNTTLENIPTKVPYLSVNSTLIQKWQDKMQGDNSKLKVGLVWQGNPKHNNDMNRSIPFNYFSVFTQLSDITFYSLQKDKGSEQLKNLPIGMKFVDLTEEINDFSDTAALIENLDLTISVDTSVAHLAGALGKSVWTLIPYKKSDWRWMINREDSPWYPTMRLFRQPQRGDWNSVMERVSEELQKLISSKA
jgi:hypothetical protein